MNLSFQGSLSARYLFPASDYRESLNAEIAFFTFYYCADSTNTTRFRIG